MFQRKKRSEFSSGLPTRDGQVGVLVLGSDMRRCARRTGAAEGVPAGEQRWGPVADALGRAMDGEGPVLPDPEARGPGALESFLEALWGSHADWHQGLADQSQLAVVSVSCVTGDRLGLLLTVINQKCLGGGAAGEQQRHRCRPMK